MQSESSHSGEKKRASCMRWVVRGLVVLVVLLLVTAGTVWFLIRASLPMLVGEARITGLSGPVTIHRDLQGVPLIRAGNRSDLARATGFLHGQERFFQMDLLRRAASGELPELFGPSALEMTREVRLFRLRQVAQESLRQLAPHERAILDSYTQGVNAGLEMLGARPPEYLLLRQKPRLWKPEDSILVLHAMGLQLSAPFAEHKADMAIFRSALPAGAFDFFVRPDTHRPASLDGARPPKPQVPGPEVFDLRRAKIQLQGGGGIDFEDESSPGSNIMAVRGTRTRSGLPILANDMHLGLGLPNVWYRMQWFWKEERGETNQLIGVTLPGAPAMIVGSNTKVAWGFTAAQLDVSDQVMLETDPSHPDSCRLGEAWWPFEMVREEIPVAGGTNVILQVPWSPWGPVGTNLLGQTVAFRWAMMLPEAANFEMLKLERCSSVDDVLSVAVRCGVPWLNVIAVDHLDNIGWTMGGKFPRRFGMDPRFPVSWADGKSGWNGWVKPSEFPLLRNPTDGVLWNANHLALGSEDYLRIAGADTTDNGARGGQIRDGLLALTNAVSKDLLALQLDDRALMLTAWQERLLQVLDRGTNEQKFVEARPFVAGWSARASVDSVGYRLVRAFRLEVQELLLKPVLEVCRQVVPQVRNFPGHRDGVVEDLLVQRPMHLLPAVYASYEELMSKAAKNVLEKIPADKPLRDFNWGERNRVHVQHPISRAVPFLGRWLDLPSRPLAGDAQMPRVQGTSFGASERLVVTPGREAEGIFHMPGGQSGHFLSPHYAAGHTDWENGSASPLLPGEPRHELRLVPK